jgi:hypothetical protein
MPDPRPDCPSCVHLRAILAGIEYLHGLVPAPEHVHDTYVYVAQLHGGHLATSHPDNPVVAGLTDTTTEGR